MKQLCVNFFALLFILLSGNLLSAQSNFFSSTEVRSLPEAVETTKNINKFSIHRLDETGLRDYLSTAPTEFKNDVRSLPLEIPMPDGSVEVFGLVESSILSPEIAAEHPEIKFYTGNGLRNKGAVIRITLTSSGFHAVVLDYKGDEVYFDHYSDKDKDLYYNYFTRDAISPPDFSGSRCGAEISGSKLKGLEQGDIVRNNTGATLSTFRLAMAANKEFTAQNGGNQNSSFNKVVNYVATMDLIYRRELSVTFTLVSGTNLIYTATNPGPYSNDLDLMLDENQTNCDDVIGNANYDIAFVLGGFPGTSGGGLASFGVVCDDSSKAQGAGNEGGSPYAQVFGDQLVLHEIGHMFAMDHSYNSSEPNVCSTRNPPTSVEPGSGATIMSYGFTCDYDDYFSSTTNGPILTFHTANYEQAFNFINTISCQASAATGNNPPVVTMPSNVTIPKSTPFALEGSADTPESGDSYTYSWEGTDIGIIVPTPATLDDTTQPPFFRSYEPSSTGSRTFPVLSAILDGTNQAKGDKLPSVSTSVNLRLTVRDNNPAGGGLSYGSVVVTVDDNIGPFLETTNLSGLQAAGSTPTITWSVNGTDTATPNVNILLSTDGGLTFPTTLVANTPNDGSQSVTLPSVQTTSARIKVEAVGNIFFDISNNDFEIAIAGCTAEDSEICPTAAETFTQGDAGLDLTLSNSFGTAVTEHSFNLTASSPSGPLANATTPGGSTCDTPWGTEEYETFDFTVASTGTYTFTQPGIIAFSVFEAAGYNPTAPCSSTFLGSNTTGAISIFGSMDVTLTECVAYKLVVWTLNSDYEVKTISFTGPGSVLPVVAAPADAGYTYVAVNNSNNQIAAQSATSDFTSLTVGTYNVQGASYKNGGAVSPPNSNPANWVGQTVASVQSSECVVFSSNSKMLTVTQALPVQLVKFEAELQNEKDALLQWQTAAEENSYGFEIQEAIENFSFEKVGFVSARNAGSSLSNYSFVQRNLTPGTHYYRLKMVDIDGSFDFSEIRTLKVSGKDEIMRIFPNPSSNGKFELLLDVSTNQLVEVYVVNSIGQIVSDFTSYINESSQLQFQLPGAGYYNVIVVLENGVQLNQRVISLQ